MSAKTSFIVLILVSIILGFRCKPGESESSNIKDTVAVSNSLRALNDTVHHDQLVKPDRKKVRIGMEVFYRRSGGLGDEQFGGLEDGDTIHYGKGEGMMTQRVYQVTHSGTGSDSLESIILSIYSKGKLLKTSTVDFRIQKREHYPVITFYDGIPEPAEDLIQISFNFIDKHNRTKNEIKIYMLLDLELKYPE